VAGRSLKPATDRGLGEPLPHQQANPPFPAVILLLRADSHVLLTRSPLKLKTFVRLACVKHTASVHPEPGSNSPWYFFFFLIIEN